MKRTVVFLLIFYLTAVLIDGISYFYFVHNSLKTSISIDLMCDESQEIQVFYTTDTGQKFNEQSKISAKCLPSKEFQLLKFDIPSQNLHGFRIDLVKRNEVIIREIKVSRGKYHIIWGARLISSFFRENKTLKKNLIKDQLTLKPLGADPYLSLKQDKQGLQRRLFRLGGNKLVLLIPELLISWIFFSFIRGIKF